MSEPKMISPMLDNFIMGGSMSEHHGVRCYPAIENETGDRYIVKVISVPAVPSQLDALLLTGAYADKTAALAYFKELADGVISEVDTLEKLAELEGFIAYTACQIEPMESGDGYDIYLLGTYKRTLQKHFKRHSFTHLDALNLGLDLCAALSVCRRLGYLYVDLKPSNVFVTDQRLFRIGDLGFVRLDSLKYASVPEKYISVYTPPEIRDAFSALNSTMDVYAAGLILYQTYNNGELPFSDEIMPGDQLPSPLYADYEMSEIILKACAPNPEDRWQDPTQMGQAIISYMQRNGAMDTPIVPMPIPEEPVAAVQADDTESETDPEDTVQADIEEVSEESADMDETVDTEEAPVADIEEQPTSADPFPEEEPPYDDEEISAEDYDSITEEVTDMLNQADELAAMDVPEPVVVPEHVDVPMPEPIEPEAEVVETDSAEVSDNDAGTSVEDTEGVSAEEDTAEDETPTVLPKKRSWVRYTILAIAILAVLVGGFFFYKHYYLLPIEFIAVEGNMDTLTVYVTTDIDESLLTVICSDTYGNKVPAPVVNGKAEFTGLVANTAYRIKVVANGFHRLTGNASTAYSTPVQSHVVQFDAVTGTTEDSAILSFTVDGPNCDQWTVVYSAEGEEERTATFTSHMVTLTGLTVGKEYAFRLVPGDDLYVTGQSELLFTPRKLIKAEDLNITSCLNNTLTAKWNVPEGEDVDSWSVHCFNDTYNQTIITADTAATFQDLDHTAGYTVEVKAAGMSVSQSTSISANSITAANFSTDTSDPTKMVFSWEPSQEISEDGWLLRYRVVGIDSEETIPCETNAAVIAPVIPNATYRIQLEDMKGNVLLGSVTKITTGEPVSFSKEFASFTAEPADLEFSMCKTPNRPGWGRYDLSADDYRTTFSSGEAASFLVKFQKLYSPPAEDVTIMYVTRNQDGAAIHSGVQISTWKDMWPLSYCKLNIPAIPTAAGSYTMEIYFNGGLAHRQEFTVTQ